MKGESSLLVMHQPNALEMTEVPRVLKGSCTDLVELCSLTRLYPQDLSQRTGLYAEILQGGGGRTSVILKRGST